MPVTLFMGSIGWLKTNMVIKNVWTPVIDKLSKYIMQEDNEHDENTLKDQL